uniref:TFIIS N-terminal domain-containing protein n=1 Tax=Leersia perrieri TaxID=77586 RepID=A0A0D9VTF5_9ORYZ
MAAQGPLRRWKRFLPAFASVDDAIEAANPAISRAEFRNASFKILEMLDNETDPANAQKFCVVLDDVMVESLRTLEMVAVKPKLLASTELARDIGDLRNHESERVRGLATGIVRGWRASVKADLIKATAAMEKLSHVLEPDEPNHRGKILEPSAPKKTASFSEPSFPAKKQSTPAVVGSSTDEKAINAAKRKLREGYEEAEEAKRQRTVKVIEAPEVTKQRQKKMHPILRERSRSRAASHMSSRCRKRFLPAFASVDDAIEAANPEISRTEFRDTSLKILEMLVNETDAAEAQKLCVVLDDVMVESLRTLEMVAVKPKMLASTDLARDVGDLRNHESERVRGLATGIVRGWRASVKAELAEASSAMEKLCHVMEPDKAPKKTANSSEPSFPNPKKQSAPVVKTAKMMELPAVADEKAMSVAKRKLREGYEEAEEAKRQRTVKVIEAPEMTKQRQRKMHPILRERSRSRTASHTSDFAERHLAYA